MCTLPQIKNGYKGTTIFWNMQDLARKKSVYACISKVFSTKSRCSLKEANVTSRWDGIAVSVPSKILQKIAYIPPLRP